MKPLAGKIRKNLPKPKRPRDMSVDTARDIRRKLCRIVDKAQIRPRTADVRDDISLALFLRMAELHESICLLVKAGRRRDAVILARTLCEANISYFWLTNKDTAVRCDRYWKFGVKVRSHSAELVEKYFGIKHSVKDEREKKLFKNAEEVFGKTTKWNKKSLADMANEADEHDPKSLPGGPLSNPQYSLFYYWSSLLAHPCIEAIQNFLPESGKVFLTTQKPNNWQSPIEPTVLWISTMWFFQIVIRMDILLKLDIQPALQSLFNKVKFK